MPLVNPTGPYLEKIWRFVLSFVLHIQIDQLRIQTNLLQVPADPWSSMKVGSKRAPGSGLQDHGAMSVPLDDTTTAARIGIQLQGSRPCLNACALAAVPDRAACWAGPCKQGGHDAQINGVWQD